MGEIARASALGRAIARLRAAEEKLRAAKQARDALDKDEPRIVNTYETIEEFRAAQGGVEPWAPAPDTDAMADAIRARWEQGPRPGEGGSRR
jgi:hypothetical protein